MPRTISPAMKARSEYVGAKMKLVGRKSTAAEMSSYHADFDREFPEFAKGAKARSESGSATPRANPWSGEDVAEEVASSTVGTVVGLGLFGLIVAGIVSAAKRAQARLNGQSC